METPRGEKKPKNNKNKQPNTNPNLAKKPKSTKEKNQKTNKQTKKKKNPKTTNPSKLHCKLDSVSCLN